MSPKHLSACRDLLVDKYPETLTRMKAQRLAGLDLLAEVEVMRTREKMLFDGAIELCQRARAMCALPAFIEDELRALYGRMGGPPQ